MKKIYTLFSVLIFSAAAYAQTTCPVQVQVTGATCNGMCNGTATAFGSGSPPFMYSWFPGGQTTQTVTGLCAGTYSVVVINGAGCTGNGVANITQPSQIFISVSGTNSSSCTSCNGTLTANVTGGTPGYTFMWATTPSQT